MTTGSTHPCHTGMTRRYLPSTFRLSDSHFITFIYYYDLYIYIYIYIYIYVHCTYWGKTLFNISAAPRLDCLSAPSNLCCKFILLPRRGFCGVKYSRVATQTGRFWCIYLIVQNVVSANRLQMKNNGGQRRLAQCIKIRGHQSSMEDIISK